MLVHRARCLMFDLYIMLIIALVVMNVFSTEYFYADLCFLLCQTCLLVVVVDPTPPTCCQQSPAPESCGSQQSLPPGGKERLHFVGIRPEVQARKGGW